MITSPVKSAATAVVFLLLATIATLCHYSDTVAWQIVGSWSGLLALSLLVAYLAQTYPWFGLPRHPQDPPRALFKNARRLIPPALVVLVSVAVLAPLLKGQMPLSHDHPVHLYKSWHFWDEMLLSGRLRGWSSFWFFGYPAEELYPIGPDIWVAAFRLGTLGLFSWETTYGLAFVGVFAFAAYAVYSFGRRYLSPLAGVMGALFWILDRGDYREGGWSYTVDWAVWVQILAMAFALLAIARLQDVLERGRPRDFAIAGLLFAAALLSHPMNVIVFGVGLPLFLLCRWLAAGKPLGKELAYTAGACALGVALAGFWFLPMMARSGWTTSIGDLWRPLSSTVKGLLDGTVFANVWPAAAFLGLVGAALGIAMRRWVAVFLMLLAAVMLFASTSTAFHELSLMSVSKAFSKIQYQRLVIPAKACLFLLAGFAINQLVIRVRAWREERTGALAARERELEHQDAGGDAPAKESEQDSDGDGAEDRTPASAEASTASTPPRGVEETPVIGDRLRGYALAALICLILAPFARPALEQIHRAYLRTIGGLVLKKSIHYWADYKKFLDWSAKKRAAAKDFYRISYELDRHNHLMMGAPAYNRTPYYKVGYTPAKLFKHVTETTEDPLYRALSVAYVVSQHPLSRPRLRQEAQFGSIRVYRFEDYRPQRYTLTGPGKVVVKEFGEERIHLSLSGTGKGSRLKVHVANYPRWRARQDGRTLNISEAPVYGSTYPMLMEVPVKDGDLIFDYVMGGVDILGTLASLAGLGAVTLLLLVQRRERLAAWLRVRLEPFGRLAVRYLAWALLLSMAVMVVMLFLKVRRGSTGMAENSLSRLLNTARVTQASRQCTERKRDAWFCSGRSWNYVGPTTNMFNGAFLPCIWAHPVDQGPLEITFPRVRLGRALVGSHGLADGAVDSFPGGAPVTLEIKVNGRSLERLTRPNQKGWVGFRVDTGAHADKDVELSLTITTPSAGGRHYCFDARIER